MSPSSRPANGPASSVPELDHPQAGERPGAGGLACRGRAHDSPSARSRASATYARSRRSTKLARLVLRELEEPAPGLDAVLPARDVVAQDGGRREAVAEATLERVEDVGVDVEPRHVGDRERAEEREPEAERRADDLVDLLGRRDAVLDDPRRLPEHRELDPVRDEPRAVPDDDGDLAERGQGGDDVLDDARVGRGGRDHLDARHEQRRHEPVDAEEPARAPQR